MLSAWELTLFSKIVMILSIVKVRNIEKKESAYEIYKDARMWK